LPGRGRDASEAEKPPWEVQAVLTAIDELEPLDPAARDGWMYSNEFDNAESAAPWVLRFTNSRTFHRNDGLTGYAYKRPDCTTPEVLLRVNSPRRGFCIVEEPIVRPGAASASPGDSVEAECAWSVGPKDALKLEPQQMRADGREWAARDPNVGDEVDMDADKAIRVLAATRPVYLDGGLLVLRSAVLDEIVFVWTRNGADDPPPVDVTPPDEGEAGLPASIAAVLAARDATKTKRPANREIINRYN